MSVFAEPVGPGRPGLLHRLLHPVPGRRTFDVNPVALGLTVGGFLLSLVAQLLPWAALGPDAAAREGFGDGGPQGVEIYIASMPSVLSLAYYLLWAPVLAALALALAGPVRGRMPAAVAGLGLTAALLLIIVAMVTAGDGTLGRTAGSVETTLREGFYCTAASLVLVCAALAAAPRRHRWSGPVLPGLPGQAVGPPMIPQQPPPPPPPPYQDQTRPYQGHSAQPSHALSVSDLTVSPAGPVMPAAPVAPPAGPPVQPGDSPWSRRG